MDLLVLARVLGILGGPISTLESSSSVLEVASVESRVVGFVDVVAVVVVRIWDEFESG